MGSGMQRRVTVNEYHGHFYVNVREFFSDKYGLLKPGNKGIALSFENWDQMYAQVCIKFILLLACV